MLEKITRNKRWNMNQLPGPSSCASLNLKRFDRNMFQKTFFASVLKYFNDHPDKEQERNEFRELASDYMLDMMGAARASHALQRRAEIQTNMGLNVPDEDRHLLAKRPRPTNLDESGSEDSSLSSADSDSPKRFDDTDEEADDPGETFHEFLDKLGCRFSNACDQFNRQTQRNVARSLIRYACIACRTRDPPQELTTEFYGISRRQIKSKKRVL